MSKPLGSIVAASLISLSLGVAPGGACAASYRIMDLGTLGGSYSQAHDINDLGQVVGSSSTSAGVTRAFIWDSVNGMRDLGALDGKPNAIAAGINNYGQVVGTASILGTRSETAFFWDAVNGMQDIGTLGGAYSQGRGINDNGQAVGLAVDSSGRSRGFLWDAVNGIRDIGTLGGQHSFANAINDNGQVVGSAWNSNNADHAFLWDATNGMVEIIPDYYTWSSARDIANNGLVIGETNSSVGFMWDAVHGTQELFFDEWIMDRPYGLNERGEIVGRAMNYYDGFREAAVLWDASNGIQDLCVLVDCALAGWDSLDIATAINENGDIVGWGRIEGETRARAFLIQAAVVPVPAAAWLLASGFIGLIGFNRRAKA